MEFLTHHNQEKGFALLFTVLIISLILSIALSISNLTLKQAVLSGLVRDSQIAFYQADAAVECGLYQDTVLGLFPVGTTPDSVPRGFYCGNTLLELDELQSSVDHFVYRYTASPETAPCYNIVFDKTTPTDTTAATIQGYGYNSCLSGPRQVERALEVQY